MLYYRAVAGFPGTYQCAKVFALFGTHKTGDSLQRTFLDIQEMDTKGYPTLGEQKVH